MKPISGSAIEAVAKSPEPRAAEREGLTATEAIEALRSGRKLFRRSGKDERWGYWESIEAYLMLGSENRIDVINGNTGQIACFDWRFDLDSLNANDWYILK